jgi:hypothetical protein
VHVYMTQATYRSRAIGYEPSAASFRNAEQSSDGSRRMRWSYGEGSDMDEEKPPN